MGTSDVAPTDFRPEVDQFEVGGAVFTFASAPPREELERLVRAVHKAVTEVERFEGMIALIRALLSEGDRERWDAVCERREDPVPTFQFPQIFDWVLEVVEPEFAQTLPKEADRFKGQAEAVVRRWKHVEVVVRQFERRSAPCSVTRTRSRGTTRTRRRGGTARRITRAGPSRSSDPPESESVAPPGRR